jgi:hypothetical protein
MSLSLMSGQLIRINTGHHTPNNRREGMTKIELGQFYIAYGKYLMLDDRCQKAVMAAIDSFLEGKGRE